jgi:hypothetical protein
VLRLLVLSVFFGLTEAGAQSSDVVRLGCDDYVFDVFLSQNRVERLDKSVEIKPRYIKILTDKIEFMYVESENELSQGTYLQYHEWKINRNGGQAALTKTYTWLSNKNNASGEYRPTGFRSYVCETIPRNRTF